MTPAFLSPFTRLPSRLHAPPLCALQPPASSPSTPSLLSRTPARTALDALISTGGRSAAGVEADVESAVNRLVAEDASPPAPWPDALTGRWDLRLSTETPLVRLLRGTPPFGVADVYQVLTGRGTLQNVVCFASGFELVVDSDCQASEGGEGGERSVAFQFTGTVIRLPKAFGVRLPEIRIPFAVGKGEFRVVYLDQIRIDICDVESGERWINVYSYGGPAEKCDAYD